MNIIALHKDWKCSKKDSQCPSVYYYGDPNSGEHLPLNHECLDVWASAMVCFIMSLILTPHLYLLHRLKAKTLLLFRNHLTTSSLTWTTKISHLFFNVVWPTRLNQKQPLQHLSSISHSVTILQIYCVLLPQQVFLCMLKILHLFSYIHLDCLGQKWMLPFSASSLILHLRPWKSQNRTTM